MKPDYDNATKIIEEAHAKFDNAVAKLLKSEQQISDTTKKASENVRIATSKLAEGLTRIEKQANFDKLERYVELLERAEKSITALSLLENNGKLEKIISALK
jgi:hypothetical protein